MGFVEEFAKKERAKRAKDYVTQIRKEYADDLENQAISWEVEKAMFRKHGIKE